MLPESAFPFWNKCPAALPPAKRVKINQMEVPSLLQSGFRGRVRKAVVGWSSISTLTHSSLVNICTEQAIFCADILHLVKCQQIQRDVALTSGSALWTGVSCCGPFILISDIPHFGFFHLRRVFFFFSQLDEMLPIISAYNYLCWIFNWEMLLKRHLA